MARRSEVVSESLRAYRVQPGRVKVKSEQVSLEAFLGTQDNPKAISLQYPFITARMQCVVGPKMAVAAGRNGILTMIPRNLRDEDKEAIIRANNEAQLVRDYINFLGDPISARPDLSYKVVMDTLVNRHGHSIIPIIDDSRKLRGVYIHDSHNPPIVHPSTLIEKLAQGLRENPISEEQRGIRYLVNTEDEHEIQGVFEEEERTFIPVVNEDMVFQKLAFLQKYDTNFIGMAISTRGNWRAEIKRWAEKVDTLVLDSSNVWFDDAFKIVRYVKESEELKKKPFGVGNIVSKEAFMEFAEAGVDYVIGGMGGGSICITGSDEGRGMGRGQMTVARELAEARDKYAKEKGRYVCLVLDGGVDNVQTMSVGLGFADLVMMGNYFNRFFESAGKKLDADKEEIHDEGAIKYVESWGEGNPCADIVAKYGIDGTGEPDFNQNGVAERYGNITSAGGVVEGVKKPVKYRGRLKPCVEEDARGLRANISNTGAGNLKEYRELAVFEKIDLLTYYDLRPHGLAGLTEKGD